MTDAYIVSALRTPVGRKKGSLASMHPADLGAIPLKETFNRVSLDPALVEDVIYGCVLIQWDRKLVILQEHVG